MSIITISEEELQQLIRQEVGVSMQQLIHPEIPIHPLTEAGGRLPVRMTDGAIGWDCFLRALVDKDRTHKNPDFPYLRASIFDFQTWPNTANGRDHVKEMDRLDGPGKELVWILQPGEKIMGGIGFATAMDINWGQFYWVAPRSGLAANGVTLGNAPGTVDPDYGGEAGVDIWNNSSEVFELRSNMRIAQVIFSVALLPELIVVENYADLATSRTKRNIGSFGSTGVYTAK